VLESVWQWRTLGIRHPKSGCLRTDASASKERMLIRPVSELGAGLAAKGGEG
jgi:hypothetical protein